VASLAEVRDAVFPAATTVGGATGSAADAAVGWVRIMRPRVPAFDALEAGDLVIVPAPALDVVAPDDVAAGSLVDALLAAPVAGVLLVGEAAPDVLPALVAGGLPVYRLARGEPAAIERSAIGYLVNRRAELERLAGELERRLEGLALDDTGVEALVGEVAATLGRAVGLEDRHGRPASVHAPPPGEAGPTGAGATSSVALRVPLPAAGDAPPGGALTLLGPRPVTELERLAADRVAPLLALAVARDDAVRTARDASRRSDALPTGGPPWVVVLARQADAASDRSAVATGALAPEAMRRDIRLLAPARKLALRGDAASLDLRIVLAGDADDAGAEALTSRLAALVARPVARSRPFDRAVDRPLAEAEARTTLETWEQLVERRAGSGSALQAGPVVLRAERLPAYRMLVGLHNLPDGRRQAEALLAPVVRGVGARTVHERLRTLRALLESAGGAEAAAALGIHRNTLAYRARRIEEITGWRLADPDLRLPLLMALELVQTDQQ
jgi:PucR C-terminal helix-turn-helix domain